MRMFYSLLGTRTFEIYKEMMAEKARGVFYLEVALTSYVLILDFSQIDVSLLVIGGTIICF